MRLLARLRRRRAAPEPGPAPRSAARSHAGRVRPLNEDRCLDRPEAGLFAVADGMGGHQAGDVAAEAVIAALAGIEESGPALFPAIERAVAHANRDLIAARGADGVSGATLVTLALVGRAFHCLWAGDSRAYRLSAGRLERLTRDHSLVQQMVDAGALDPAAAARHPQAHVITRAVGVEPDLALEGTSGAFAAGDRFLLCSDGLSDVLDDPALAALLADRAPAEAADALVAAALAAGAPDNVSAVVVDG